MSRASAATRAHAAAAGVPGSLRFNTISLQEPAKRRLLDFYHGRGPRPPRRAVVWVLNPPHGTLFEGVVEFGAGGGDRMLVWKRLDGLQPTATPCDCTLAEEIILADGRVSWDGRDWLRIGRDYKLSKAGRRPQWANLAAGRLLNHTTQPTNNRPNHHPNQYQVMAMVEERYGITDTSLIVFDPWTLHGTPAGMEGRRLMQGFLYVRTSPTDNE